MKTKLFSFFTVALLFVVTAVPALAASGNYGFTMSLRVVDGSENGQFYTLNKGSATIKGTHAVVSSLPGALGPNPINYQLYNKTSGNSFGIVKATPLANGERTTVSGTYTGLGGGTSYYLYIWRTDDGRTVNGSGTISN